MTRAADDDQDRRFTQRDSELLRLCTRIAGMAGASHARGSAPLAYQAYRRPTLRARWQRVASADDSVTNFRNTIVGL
jgi:hypothetical protein